VPVAEGPGPLVARTRLATQLRNLRDDRPAAQVAEAMHWSLSKLNRIENTKVTVQPLEVRALASYYGVEDEDEIKRLVDLSVASRQRMWWRDQHGPEDYLTFVAFENDASHLFGYQATYLPPLLQTREYATALSAAVLRLPPNDPVVQNIVDLRMRRQETLTARLAGPNPPRLSQAIDEAVLLRPIGGEKVMAAQFDHLLAMSRQPTVDLKVIPLSRGAHPGLGGTFELLTFSEDDDLDVVFIETPGTDFLLTDAENTTTFRLIMDELMGSDTDSLDAVVGRARASLDR
jgi:hypothetical protein